MFKGSAIALVMLMACGGETSPEERICEAANGCGALASAGVQACVDTLGTVDAERALEECADCLEAKTCAQITSDECVPNCGQFQSLFVSATVLDRNKSLKDLTQPEAEKLCMYSIAQLGGENVREACSGGYYADNGTIAACISGLLASTCPQTVGSFQDCYASCNSPCDYIVAPACEQYFNCPQ